MRIGIKRFFPLLLVALLLALTGCGQENPSVREVDFDIPDRVVLRVVVDPPYEWFLDHVESISEKFTAVYENVTIEVEELPGIDMKQVRTNAVRKMQEDLAAGEGPDIFFLMSTASNEAELFPDMNFAMRKGCFSDLNEYYTSDADLNREELVDEVMEVGVVSGARYLLPLSYEYSLVYADMNRLYEAGLDSSIFDSGVISLLDAVCRLGDVDMADSLRGIELAARLLQYFPNALDYDTGEVLLTAEELTPFLEQMQQYKALCSGQRHDAGVLQWYYEGHDWWQEGYCMRWDILTDVTEQAAIAKALGFDLQMYPLTGAEGKTTAEVRWAGAVNANCEYPEVAYEFLRMFLLPEAMTDTYVLNGFPVRSRESVAAMYQQRLEDLRQSVEAGTEPTGEYDADYEAECEARWEALRDVEVTDFDIPLLDQPIDVVQMVPQQLKKELDTVIRQLNDPETGEPTDVNIELLAKGYIQFLESYLHGTELGGE